MKRLDAIRKFDIISEYDREKPLVVYRHFYYHFDSAPVLQFWRLVLGLKREHGAKYNSAIQDFLLANRTWEHFVKRITDIKHGLRWVNIFHINEYCFHRIVWDDVYNGIREINDIIAIQKFIRIYQRNLYLK